MAPRYRHIAVSGIPGSGKSTVVRSLSDELKWPVYPFGEKWRALHKQVAPEKTFEKFWEETTIEDNVKMNRDMLGEIAGGNWVIDTRYPHIIPDALYVFVDCDLKTRAERAERTGKYLGRSAPQIEVILRKRETEEFVKGVKIYQRILGEHLDYRTRSRYDVVLDSAVMTPQQEHKTVMDHLMGLVKPRKLGT